MKIIMPLVTIYISKEEHKEFLSKILDEFNEFTAKALSCQNRELNLNEMSIRVCKSEICKPISNIEVVVMVYSYQERIDRQDEICRELKEFLLEKCNNKFSVSVWLQLSELGYSL